MNNTEPKSTGYCTLVDSLPTNKAADLLAYGKSKPNVISLAQGEGSNITPDFIINAAMNAAKDGNTFYISPLGLPQLRDELSDYYKRIYDFNISKDRIFVTSSGTTAVHLCLHSILEDQDEVIAITPIWKNLLGEVAEARGQIKEHPLTFGEDNKWSLDMDALFSKVTDKTKAIMVVTPSNPTGWVMSDEEIQKLIKFAREKDIWIIADEVYSRIVFNDKHAPSFLKHATDDDKIYIVNSFSKAWSMTGWRLGWITGPKSAEKRIQDLALYNNMGPSAFLQFGALEALKNGEEYLKQNLDLWQRNKKKLEEVLSRHNHVINTDTQATFYGFFKVNGQPDCYKFTKELIDDYGISVAPGHSFGEKFNGWLRICYALSEELTDEALDRLDKGLAK